MTKDPNAFVTNQTLDEAVDTILKGMDNLFENQKKELGFQFNKVDKRFDKIETDMFEVKDEIKGLKADLSDTPFALTG